MSGPARIARAQYEDAPCWVGAEHDGPWRVIEDPFDAFARGAAPRYLSDPLGELALLAPVEPRTVVGIAQNGPAAQSPVQAWLKSPRTVVPSGTPVTLRSDAGRRFAEAEIAVVIAADAFQVPAAQAASVVLGVTAVNDLSSPDRAALDPRNFESKAGVGFTPLGPWIDTTASLDHVPYSLLFDGSLVAASDASELPSSIAECIAYVTSWLPLGPGDVIMAGAPVTSIEIAARHSIEVRVGGVRLITPLG